MFAEQSWYNEWLSLAPHESPRMQSGRIFGPGASFEASRFPSLTLSHLRLSEERAGA